MPQNNKGGAARSPRTFARRTLALRAVLRAPLHRDLVARSTAVTAPTTPQVHRPRRPAGVATSASTAGTPPNEHAPRVTTTTVLLAPARAVRPTAPIGARRAIPPARLAPHTAAAATSGPRATRPVTARAMSAPPATNVPHVRSIATPGLHARTAATTVRLARLTVTIAARARSTATRAPSAASRASTRVATPRPARSTTSFLSA